MVRRSRTWHHPGISGYTARIQECTAELVHFGDAERAMGAEMLRWSSGTWSLDCSGESGALSAGVHFSLPPEALCTLTVSAQ